MVPVTLRTSAALCVTLGALALLYRLRHGADALRVAQDPLPPLQGLAPTKACDDWPSTELEEYLAFFNVDTGSSMGWLCMHGEQRETLHRPRGDSLTPDQCSAWCFAEHPPGEFRRARRNASREGGADLGWCCEWRPQDGGQCSWSDGAQRFMHVSSSCAGGGENRTCRSPLAFGLCTFDTNFRILGGGRCLEHDDILIGRYAAASANQCALRCEQHARFASPGGPRCRMFGFPKPPEEGGSRSKSGGENCVLLTRCKLRPRNSRTTNYFGVQEAIPSIPALT